MTHTENSSSAGFVHEAVVRIVLVVLIAGQLVFLGSRYHARLDLTGDRLFTLTDSTKRVIQGLDDRLLIECYFSPESKLSTAYQERRRALNNFLDELVQMSDGKVVLQRFDPQDDQMVKEKAERLGIQGITIGDRGDASFSYKELWQGLRMMYGADRQDVIPFVSFHGQSLSPTAMWEAEFTPKIKALTVEQKTKIGVLAFATEAGQRSPYGGPPPTQAKGFTQLSEVVKGSYELENVTLNEGALVPEDIGTLMLIRPKRLTDRQMYALDQFLMRGGNLVVFADTAEVEIGQQRTFRTRKVTYNAPDASLKFLDQLAHYGAKVENKIVVEGLPDARSTEAFAIMRQTAFGNLPQRLEPYPYWFHALPLDYADYADQFARQSAADGDVGDLTARYRELFKPGVDIENTLFKAANRGPGMFWACPVDLKGQLPEGVAGEVLLRTSPLAYAEEPPPDVNPLGMDPHPNARLAAFRTFQTRIATRMNSEPRQQLGLMVHLKGSFGSFFDGKEIPPRKKPQAAPPPTTPDPLSGPIVESPVTKEPPAATETPKEEPKEEPKKSGETPKKEGDGADGGAAVTQEPQGQEPQATVAPPPAGEQDAEKEQDPDPIMQAPEHAQLIVIGDSDFVRDDLITGEYRQTGPVSAFGPVFFQNLVDWMAEDQDLLELRNKTSPDRRLRFATPELDQDPAVFAEQIKARGRLLGYLNVGLPVIAIIVIWVLASLRRRSRKQSFLSSMGG